MRAKEVGKLVAGSVLVYGVVVACSGSGGGGGSGGGPGGAGGDAQSLVDQLASPEGQANADVYQSGARLKGIFLGSSDGAKQFLFRWHDATLNLDCTFQTAGDNTIRCLPDGSQVIYFSDASCGTPLASPKSSCAAPAYYAVFSPGGQGIDDCGNPTVSLPRSKLYTQGAAYSGNAWTNSTGGCQPVSGVGYTFFSLTEVDYTQFQQATQQVEP